MSAKILGGNIDEAEYAGQLYISDALSIKSQLNLENNSHQNIRFSSIIYIHQNISSNPKDIITFLETIVENHNEWNNWIIIECMNLQFPSENALYFELFKGEIACTPKGQKVVKNIDGRIIKTRFAGNFNITMDRHNKANARAQQARIVGSLPEGI